MIKGLELEKLLPHEHPMLMVDTLVKSDSEITITNFTIKQDNVFCNNGILKEAGLIENMAQTAALRSGYNSKLKNSTVQTGYIASIKNLTILFLPKINEIIETKVIQKTEIGNIKVISAYIKLKEKLIAKCEMTVIIIDNMNDFK